MSYARWSTVLLLAVLVTAACEVQRRSETTGSPLAPTDAIPSLMGTWASTDSVGRTSAESATCTNFVWTVTSQTATDITGTFTAVCLGSASITGSGSGHIEGSIVSISISGNGSMPGLPECPFSLSGTGTIEGDLIRVPYSGNTCLGPVSGTQTLQRSLIQPAPPPAPTPAPIPEPEPEPAPPPPPPAPGDALAQATILNSPLDLASWPITTRITALDIRSSGVHVEFSKQDGPGRWPDVFPPGWDEPLQYTLGMCMFIDARWYCSAPIQFWHGLYESGGPPHLFAHNWFYDPSRWAPMTYHQPAVGETIGFFVCAGNCRNNTRGDNSVVKERTDVVLVPMPDSNGASFTF